METLPLLQKLTQRASEEAINLNDRIDRDESFRPLHGGHAIVYKGTMNPKGVRVAIKSLRLSPSADRAAGDVRAFHCCILYFRTNFYLAHCRGDTALVHPQARQHCSCVWCCYQVRFFCVNSIRMDVKRECIRLRPRLKQ